VLQNFVLLAPVQHTSFSPQQRFSPQDFVFFGQSAADARAIGIPRRNRNLRVIRRTFTLSFQHRYRSPLRNTTRLLSAPFSTFET